MTSNEIWKTIKGFEKYQISNLGKVRNINTGRVLKNQIDKSGYCVIKLINNKKYYHKKIHRLVAECFVKNKNNLPLVNHIDGCKNNNNYKNLEWVNHSENHKHAFLIGLKKMEGENHTQSKLSQKEVLEIRRFIEKGYKNVELAKMYGVDKTTISNIKTRKTWSHL